MTKSYTVKDYIFGKTCVRYVLMNDTQKIFMYLLPTDVDAEVDDTYWKVEREGQFMDHYDWYPGTLCYVHLSHHSRVGYTNSYKLSEGYDALRFKSQEKLREDGKTVIRTVLCADEGYEVIHNLTNYDGEAGFEVECTFVNNSGKSLDIEMMTSASLDGLSPYAKDDGSKDLYVHKFISGWASEARHRCYSLSEINLEKAWGGNFTCHKIGTQGSRATAEHFPYAAVEDRTRGVIWGIQLYHNATWQMEISRYGKPLSFTAGLGDASYGNWSKTVNSGESFTAPKALVAAVKGDITDISDVFLKMRDKDIVAYGEEGMPIIYNEWCTTWGKPSHEGNIKIAKHLKNNKIKYFVMDAGWYKAIGDWEHKEEIFPHGFKAYTDELRSMGFIPGIWIEFEATSNFAKTYGDEYAPLQLKHKGMPLRSQVTKGRIHKYWDFRNPDTIKFLDEKIIKLLKDGGFGYLKIDYNSNIGIGCDGAESPGEGLRQNAVGVLEFIKRIKEAIPDIIIETCSSGGMRLDPATLAVTAMGSFSDAHECYEFPIIAANLHYVMPPCQSQIWCVMKPFFDDNRFAFSVSAGFMGRLCWSGDMFGLSDSQMHEIYRAEDYYENVSDIIRHGKSEVYRTNPVNLRYPEGTQAVLRYSDKGDRALVVYHCFDKPLPLTVPLKGEWEIESTLYDADIELADELVINEKKEVFGNVLVLKRKGGSV